MGAIRERFSEIDDMRGLAIFAMILIHTNWYFIADKFVFYLWDLSQFAVPVFLFCSGYLYFKKGNTRWSFSYLKKRFSRLLVPYYIFVIIFLLTLLQFDPAEVTREYVTQSLLVTGAIDINWLVLLFLQLTLLMPILMFLREKRKILFYGYTGLSLFASFLIIFIPVTVNYKYIMWFLWSPIIIYSMYFVQYHTKKKFYGYSLAGSAVIFLSTLCIELYIGHSLRLFDNKYPPTLYLLSYGVFWISAIHFLAQKGLFSFAPVKRLIHFLSKHSYSLFFVHYIILSVFSRYIQAWNLNWITLFLIVFMSSLAVQWGINKVKITL